MISLINETRNKSTNQPMTQLIRGQVQTLFFPLVMWKLWNKKTDKLSKDGLPGTPEGVEGNSF